MLFIAYFLPVVPLEGTWIEIHHQRCLLLSLSVVPLEGTWIEIRILELQL